MRKVREASRECAAATFEFEKWRDVERFVVTHLEFEKVRNLLDLEGVENRAENGILRLLKFTGVQNHVEYAIRIQIE